MLELVNDYKIFDNKITCDLIDSVGTQTLTDVIKLEKELTENSASDGVYQSAIVEFQFKTLDIARIPTIGGTIVDDFGNEFTILEVRQQYAHDFWGAICKEKELTSNLSGLVDTISLWRHTTATDSYGSQVVSHTESVSDIKAKIQLMPSKDADIIGKREFNRQYDVFIDLDISDGWVTFRDLIKDASLNIYTVRSWRNRNSVSEFSVIKVEKQVT